MNAKLVLLCAVVGLCIGCSAAFNAQTVKSLLEKHQSQFKQHCDNPSDSSAKKCCEAIKKNKPKGSNGNVAKLSDSQLKGLCQRLKSAAQAKKSQSQQSAIHAACKEQAEKMQTQIQHQASELQKACQA